MIVPLAVMYILANITFQMAVKNSRDDLNCTTCWDHTNHLSNRIKYFNAFGLMHWYYNPVLWVLILCLCQAVSHSFERKWNNNLGSLRVGPIDTYSMSSGKNMFMPALLRSLAFSYLLASLVMPQHQLESAYWPLFNLWQV